VSELSPVLREKRAEAPLRGASGRPRRRPRVPHRFVIARSAPRDRARYAAVRRWSSASGGRGLGRGAQAARLHHL